MFKRKGRHWPHNVPSPRHARVLIAEHRPGAKGELGSDPQNHLQSAALVPRRRHVVMVRRQRAHHPQRGRRGNEPDGNTIPPRRVQSR